MGTSKFYLAVGFIALMAVPLAFTDQAQYPKEVTNKTEDGNNTTAKPVHQYTSNGGTPQASSKQGTSNSASNKSAKTTVNSNVPSNMSKLSFLDEKVALIGGVAVLFGLLVSNMVLACCICSLRRRVSYWAITKNGNLTDVTKDRNVVGDAGLRADQAVELSTIYTMPDKTVQDRSGEEAHKAKGAGATEMDPANGDAQSPVQAEALPPEPPDEVAEPADDVTDVLLVV